MNTLEYIDEGRISLRRGGVLRVEVSDAGVERIVLSGIGSKGPVQLAPTRQPELVARMLVMLGLARTKPKVA